MRKFCPAINNLYSDETKNNYEKGATVSIKNGDVVRKLNGKSYKTVASFIEALQNLSTAAKVEFINLISQCSGHTGIAGGQ